MRKIPALALLVWLAPALASATTYYVAKNQSGASNTACDGLAPTNEGAGRCPFLDFTSTGFATVRNLLINTNSVRMEVRAGTYPIFTGDRLTSAVLLQGNGTSWAQANVLTAYNHEAVDFDGENLVREVVRMSGAYNEVNGISIRRSDSYNVEVRGGAHHRILNNVISNNLASDMVKVDGGASDVTIDGNDLSAWVSQAIDVAGAADLTVSHNYGHDPQSSTQPCMGFKFETVTASVHNNVFSGCKGVSMGGTSSAHAGTFEASGISVVSNRWLNLSGPAATTYSCTSCTFSDNDVIGGQAGMRLDGIVSQGNSNCNNGVGTCAPTTGLVVANNRFRGLNAVGAKNAFWLIESTEQTGLVATTNLYCTDISDATPRFAVDTVIKTFAQWQTIVGTDTTSQMAAYNANICRVPTFPTGASTVHLQTPSDYFTGTVRTSATCSAADVQAAIDASSDLDIVKIKAGTCSWATTVTVTKAIQLRGEQNCTLDGSGNCSSWSTIIKDAHPSDDKILLITLPTAKPMRLMHLEFQDAAVGGTNYNGVVQVTGANTDSRRLRIDHCRFTNLNGANVFTTDVLGVIDHNVFMRNASTIPVYVYHSGWNGATHADGSWAAAVNFGTEAFLFVENNYFEDTNYPFPYAITDAYRGARYVVRYNTIVNGWVEAHGSDSGGRERGTRAIEIYNNALSCNGGDTCQYVANFRSGTGLIHDNTTSGFTGPQITLAAYRLFFPFSPWDTADGRSAYDVNNAGNPFETGTATGGSTTTLVRAGAGWTTNQWAGYTVRKTSTCATPSTNQCASVIVSNTSTTLTYSGTGGYDFGDSSKVLSFSNGETYEINKVTYVLDQPGRGQGTQMSGTVPVWTNDQVDEPLYEWNNTQGATNIDFLIDHPAQILSGQHYVANTAKPGYAPYTYPHPLQITTGPN